MKLKLISHLLSLIFLSLMIQYTFAQYTQTVRLNYTDSECVRKGLMKVIQRSQEVFGGGNVGSVGEYVEGTITTGAGNGLVFRDVTAELISIEGDTTNPSARLYIFTPYRDREVTLTRGNSDLVDNYRVRVDDVNFRRSEVNLTIRQAGNVATSNTGRGYHPPGRVFVYANRPMNSVTITTDYQEDLRVLLEWVRLWDKPKSSYQYNPPASLLQSTKSKSTTQQETESIN